MEIVSFVLSPAHAYEGRPSDGPARVATTSPESIELRAGYGVVGDRYAGACAHADAAITLVAAEALEAVAGELGVAPFDPALARRTVVVRGLDVEALRGVDFTVRAGGEPILLGGRRPAAPCAWMDAVLAPGAHAALRGRAGIRAAVLGGGTLHVGPLAVDAPVDLDPARAGLPAARDRGAPDRRALPAGGRSRPGGPPDGARRSRPAANPITGRRRP